MLEIQQILESVTVKKLHGCPVDQDNYNCTQRKILTSFLNLHYDKAYHLASRELLIGKSCQESHRNRVLARISKMPVQNSNFKISARPDLATNLLQILISSTINSLVCQKGQFILQVCHRRWFIRKMVGYYTQKVKIEKSS